MRKYVSCKHWSKVLYKLYIIGLFCFFFCSHMRRGLFHNFYLSTVHGTVTADVKIYLSLFCVIILCKKIVHISLASRELKIKTNWRSLVFLVMLFPSIEVIYTSSGKYSHQTRVVKTCVLCFHNSCFPSYISTYLVFISA